MISNPGDSTLWEEAAAIYDRAEINGSYGFGQTLALLVVDFTRGFTEAASPLGSDMSAAVEATAALMSEAHATGTPVFLTINAYREDMADAGVWVRKFPGLHHLILGNEWSELDPRLGANDSDIVIVKQFPSAFFGTQLQGMLTARGVDTVVVAGTTTSGCIRASVVDSVQHGFCTFVAEDCVADRAEAPHLANLFDMRTKYADVGPSELAAAAMHECSRAVTQT
jgi:maleamate amidohydrolase